MPDVDVTVVGGGIVGLATAYRITQRNPDWRVVVLEKEATLAHHQTGHNSGVLHSGIYYRPGSLKARNCRDGKLAMQQFCDEHGIAYELCGKVIVAMDASQLPALEMIYDRGQANGVNCQIISTERLAELEPHACGIRAIHVPETGIVDFKAVCERLGEIIQQRGGEIRLNSRCRAIDVRSQEVIVTTTRGEHSTRQLINCGGLHCDRLARSAGQQPGAKILPFRGEYYQLVPEAESLCRTLIYPVPDPSFPFLGVHFTRMIHGGVECGPNAVLALAREGYRWRDVNLRDLAESLAYPGLWRLSRKYWRVGAGEIWRSLSRRAFVKALRKLVPDIQGKHLRVAPAGVRAQAVTMDGGMVDDFLIERTQRVIHVLNAPSPAATSALNIGSEIVGRLE